MYTANRKVATHLCYVLFARLRTLWTLCGNHMVPKSSVFKTKQTPMLYLLILMLGSTDM